MIRFSIAFLAVWAFAWFASVAVAYGAYLLGLRGEALTVVAAVAGLAFGVIGGLWLYGLVVRDR